LANWIEERAIGQLDSAQRWRCLVPRPVAALYNYARFGCGVSPKAIVQLSPPDQDRKGHPDQAVCGDPDGHRRITIGEHCAISNFVSIGTVDADVRAQ
jgi:hypothetical protein